jgi:hypothetical protein
MSKIDLNKVTILLWIGNNFSSDEEYQQYFHQFEGIQKDLLNPKPRCLFCADVGHIAYIREKLIMPNRFSSPQDINLIIDKIEVNESEKKKIYEQCIKSGITTANAVFWYINNNRSLNLDVKKPYKENYNGLKYIGEFNADTKYPSETKDTSSDQYLWIGTNFMPVEEYNKYFELDYTEELDSPEYKVCPFCKDIGDDWYDEDFIGYPKPLQKEIDVGELIDELISPDADCRQEIIEKCHQLGITKANALVWYKASEVELQKPYKENYNQLKYIGVFKF